MKRASQTQDCHCQERAKFTEVGRCLLLSHLTSNSLTEVGIHVRRTRSRVEIFHLTTKFRTFYCLEGFVQAARVRKGRLLMISQFSLPKKIRGYLLLYCLKMDASDAKLVRHYT
jgi:hypothetical protein